MRYTALVFVLVAGIGTLGAWMHAQPGKAYMAVQTAMDRDDPAMLAPLLDLEAIRSNMKNREAARLSPGAPGDGPGGLLGLFGQALADSVIGAFVQGVATPEGVLALLRGAAASAPPAEGKTPRTPSERLFGQASAELSGFDRYVVSAPMRGGAALRLVFARQGVKWLLSDIELAKALKGGI